MFDSRYTVTVGGTTWAIQYLDARGYIKTTSEIRSDMKESREELKKKVEKVKERAMDNETVNKAKKKYSKLKDDE
jgi:NaMN:DMB phosphoribosyltransferase